MATVVVTGGGLIGLSTAMLLAKDGHDVTVLERDPSPPPATPTDAWELWERKGVNQFRLLHMFLPRFRQIAAAELPEVIAGMDAAGALRINLLSDAPVELTGGPRPGDEEVEAVTARRPVAESVVASVAQTTPGVHERKWEIDSLCYTVRLGYGHFARRVAVDFELLEGLAKASGGLGASAGITWLFGAAAP